MVIADSVPKEANLIPFYKENLMKKVFTESLLLALRGRQSKMRLNVVEFCGFGHSSKNSL